MVKIRFISESQANSGNSILNLSYRVSLKEIIGCVLTCISVKACKNSGKTVHCS